MKLLVGGDRVFTVSEALASKFQTGDALHVVEATGEVLHIPARQREIARLAVSQACQAFSQMGDVSDAQISTFYAAFADRLADEQVWAAVLAANHRDVNQAHNRGRSTTRLEASAQLRAGMIAGLRGWVTYQSKRGKVIERVQHDGWHADLIGAELGVVAFVFEGRPNVVADATGVLRAGNTVVFRIGRDALGTAQAIMSAALQPALASSGLPAHAVVLTPSPQHAAGWALFGDARLSLAVARGSGHAVATLGGLARQAGIPVSLHGTGGAWLIAGATAQSESLAQLVYDSLDRKVCNTLNTCCVPKGQVDTLVPAVLAGLARAGKRRGQSFKLHVATGSIEHVPPALFETRVKIRRAAGDVEENQAEAIDERELGHEWEWEDTPEITLKVVADVEEAVALFNRLSPQFVACLASEDAQEHERFYNRVNAPFVGDGFTRWVDGQFALKRPELGLSNWQNGRLFGRGGVLSGDSVFTVRTRVRRSNGG